MKVIVQFEDELLQVVVSDCQFAIPTNSSRPKQTPILSISFKRILLLSMKTLFQTPLLLLLLQDWPVLDHEGH